MIFVSHLGDLQTYRHNRLSHWITRFWNPENTPLNQYNVTYFYFVHLLDRETQSFFSPDYKVGNPENTPWNPYNVWYLSVVQVLECLPLQPKHTEPECQELGHILTQPHFMVCYMFSYIAPLYLPLCKVVDTPFHIQMDELYTCRDVDFIPLSLLTQIHPSWTVYRLSGYKIASLVCIVKLLVHIQICLYYIFFIWTKKILLYPEYT